MKQALEKMLGWAIILGFMGVGASSFYWGITQEALSSASRSWPSTQGRVISSYVQKGTGKSSSWPVIKYQYTVDGIRRENDRIQFGQDGSGRETDANETIEKYRNGKPVSVYYNPKAPEVSCLEPGKYENASQFSILFGILWFLFGSLPLLWKFLLFCGRQAAKRQW